MEAGKRGLSHAAFLIFPRFRIIRVRPEFAPNGLIFGVPRSTSRNRLGFSLRPIRVSEESLWVAEFRPLTLTT
jgi:hypothetical protein